LKKFAKIADLDFNATKLIYAGEKKFSDQNMMIIPWEELEL